MNFKQFKDNVNMIIEHSNSYLEWAGEFNILCQRYGLGTCGDDVFKIVFKELEQRLRLEKENLYHGSC